MRVAVTGANGFVGSVVVPSLSAAGHSVRSVVRTPQSDTDATIADPWDPGAWRSALAGVEAVVHLIGRAHHTDDDDHALDEYRRDNVDVTRAMLEALDSTVRVVYVSSVKAVAETSDDTPLDDGSPDDPTTAYGASKLEAENVIESWARGAGASAVVLRPPLVYGPDVRGNLAALIRIADSPVPLPLGGIDNERSLIGVGSLADAAAAALQSEVEGFHRFLISDASPVSTEAIIVALRRGLGRPRRVFSVPDGALRVSLGMVGRAGMYVRLTGSLAVDPSRARNVLGWEPRESTSDGLYRLGQWYRGSSGVI